MIFGAFGIAPLVRQLWIKGHYSSSKMLCIALTNFFIFSASLGLDHRVGAEYFYLASIMLPLLFFDAHEKRNIIIGFSFAVFCALLQFLGTGFKLSPNLIPKSFPYEIFQISSFWAAFFASAIFVVVYNTLMKALKEKAVEIERTTQMQLIHSAKMSSLGEMAGGIAHEINNPLTIIIGRVEIMQTQLLAKCFTANSLHSELVKVEETARRIAKIIGGLRSFSRNSEGDQMELIGIAVIVDDVLALCREKLRVASIDLRLVGKLDFNLVCRPYQIAQILMNLILNSVDAVLPQDDKWIEISVFCEHNRATIKVVDSGKGISADIVDKIMLPFFTTKGVGKGTGLGLSISKGLAEEHEGTLEYVKSQYTTFAVTLPVNRSA